MDPEDIDSQDEFVVMKLSILLLVDRAILWSSQPNVTLMCYIAQVLHMYVCGCTHVYVHTHILYLIADAMWMHTCLCTHTHLIPDSCIYPSSRMPHVEDAEKDTLPLEHLLQEADNDKLLLLIQMS